MEEDIKMIEKTIKKVEDNKDIGFFETEEDLKFYNAVKHLLKAYKNSVSKDKIIEMSRERQYIMEQYKKTWSKKDNKYYKAEIEFNLLQELLEGDEQNDR